MSLSSLIVQREIASIREVEEALARQVLYGGDLVTNLLEVCRLDEVSLGAIVGEWYGLAPAPAGELPKAPPEALRVLAPEVAAQRSIAPLSLDAGGLVIAVSEPLAREAEQELTFALAVPITQRVAPLVRIRQALARDYGLPMDRRLTRLLGKMSGEAPRMPSVARAPAVAPPPRPPSVAPEPPPRSAPRDDEQAAAARRAAAALAGTPSTLVREAAAASAEPFRRRRGPLFLDAVTAELEEASARDLIFDLVFDFARQFFDYTAMFLVHGDIAEGRDGFGEGAPRDKVVRVGVPLDLPGVLGQARTTKKIVRSKPEPGGLDRVLLADLGRGAAAESSELVAMPIVVRTRVVAILLGDGGQGGLDEKGLAQVETVVGHGVAAFERLIVRRKLQGTVPPDAQAAAAARARAENPNLEGAVQVVVARAQKPSVPPAAEELAAPIRELMAEPMSTAAMTRREAPAARARSAPPAGAPSQPPVVISAAPPSPPDLQVVRTESENPPPPGLLSVRRHSGPPIPREEPEAADAPPPHTRVSGLPGEHANAESRRRSSGAHQKPEAPPLSFGAETYGGGYGEDEVERRLLAEIQGQESGPPTQQTSTPVFEPSSASSPRAVSPPPPPPSEGEGVEQPFFTRPRVVTDVSPGVMLPAVDPEATPLAPPVAGEDEPTPRMPPVFADVVPEPANGAAAAATAPPVSAPPASPAPASAPTSSRRRGPDSKRDKPMPASEQQVSVKAHRPPSSHEDVTRVLPSVIVDVDDEYDAIVERVLAHDDEDAEADLIRAGAKAMPALMRRFPGAITVARGLLDEGLLPRASECGPVLRLVAAQRRIALPYVLALVESKEDDARIWATYLLGELLYPEAVEAVVPRVFDDHPQVRRVARLALRTLADAQPGLVVDKLGSVAKGREQSTVRRTRAVEALGDTREENAVPILASLVNDTAGAVANAARIALVQVTRQDFGHDARAWFEWWDANGERHRLEWLMDALLSESSVLRASAGDELKAITKEYFGFYEDLPKREREKVQARYRQWWNEIGRVRFSTASRRDPR